MPAARSNLPSKQRGTPKAKGAVRAKSGCYTCRIRRKKCDEQRSADGRCTTCIRLRLECLGFGSKRPEWLRETNNVVELRDKIKSFLASQGMIKGHAGSAISRDSDCEPPTLRLSGESSDSSQSPASPTISLSTAVVSSENHLESFSVVRTDVWCHTSAPYTGTQATSLLLSRSLSPNSGSSQDSSHDIYGIHPGDSDHVDTTFVQSFALQSSFSRLSHHPFPQEEWLMELGTSETRIPPEPIIFLPIDEMVQHYITIIVHHQYLLAERAIPDMITKTLSTHSRTREAVRLLASVHHHRFCRPEKRAFEVEDVRSRLQSLTDSLLSSTGITVPEDAMAAHHVVSSILFDGGQGEWKRWLRVANQYVDGLFAQYGCPRTALLQSLEKDAFIIKTAIWFDTLAAVTTQEKPHFLDKVRIMFGPRNPEVRFSDQNLQYSMISPMGCENIVVWALAEISALAHQKRVAKERGCLSIPHLAGKVAWINSHISVPSPQPRRHYETNDLHDRRQLVAEIFRLASQLYLQSVASGDYPHVREIEQCVQQLVHCIEQVDNGPETYPSSGPSCPVVRSTVFAFFICGALAHDVRHRRIVLERLNQGVGAGNSTTASELLCRLWTNHSQGSSCREIPWRNYLKCTETLLV